MKEVYNDAGLLVELEGSPVTLVDEENGIYKVEKPFIVRISDWCKDRSNYGYSALVSVVNPKDLSCNAPTRIHYVTKKVNQGILFDYSRELAEQKGEDYGCIVCIFHDMPENVLY